MCRPDDEANYPRFAWIESEDQVWSSATHLFSKNHWRIREQVDEVPVTCSGGPSSGWRLVSDLREEEGAEDFDAYLKSK